MLIEYINVDSELEDPLEEIQEDFTTVPQIHYESLVADLLLYYEALETQVNFTEKLQQAYVMANRPWYTKVTDAFIYGKLKVVDLAHYIKRGDQMFCVWFSLMPFLGDYPSYPFMSYAIDYTAWKITNMSSQQPEANAILSHTNNEITIPGNRVRHGSTTTRSRGRGRGRGRGSSRIRETPNLNPQNQEESIADIIARTIRETVPQMLQHNREEILKASEDNAARILRETVDNNVNPEHPEHLDPIPEKECSYKEFTNTKPTIYYGTGGPVATMDWISNIEVFLKHANVSHISRFTYGISQAAELSWDEFKVMIQENYCPRSETLKLEIEFLRLEMGNESIQEYTEKFVEKVRFAPFLAANESRKIELCTEGLRPDLKRIVQVTMPKTFLQAVEAAKMADKDHHKPFPNQNNQKRNFESSNNNARGFTPTSNKGFAPYKTCATCRKAHSGVCRFQGSKCYQCGKIGHVRSNCPELAMGAQGVNRDSPRVKARSFNMKVKEARDTPDVVSGTFLRDNIHAQVLFDSGANKSFISTTFCQYLNRPAKKLENEYLVDIADGYHVIVSDVINGCVITIEDTQFLISLIPIRLGEFDIIIGMDWKKREQSQGELACCLFPVVATSRLTRQQVIGTDVVGRTITAVVGRTIRRERAATRARRKRGSFAGVAGCNRKHHAAITICTEQSRGRK
ncbi:hypothetical protein LXL04_004499 [Taraxacum kok-saghyz]